MPDSNSIPVVQDVCTDTEDDFRTIVAQSQSILSKLKILDYDALYEELVQLNVRTSENPHLQQLNADLQAVQAAKDRVSAISTDVMRHAQTYRRVADLLTEGWKNFSNQSGADKRKGEAALKMSQFEHLATEAETLFKATQGVLKNLDSKHEASSRQITCFSLMLKLRDVGRTTGDSGFMPEDFTDYTKDRSVAPSVSLAAPNQPLVIPPTITMPILPGTTEPPAQLIIGIPLTHVQHAEPPQTSLPTTLQPDATISQNSSSKTPDAWDVFAKS